MIQYTNRASNEACLVISGQLEIENIKYLPTLVSRFVRAVIIHCAALISPNIPLNLESSAQPYTWRG
ncbi:putative AC9 transposase [Fusarium oxysporum f. sp. albedinis]|nr:putative AC9 transposase [Fusarium oxysporum f. sp. albedinis]